MHHERTSARRRQASSVRWTPARALFARVGVAGRLDPPTLRITLCFHGVMNESTVLSREAIPSRIGLGRAGFGAELEMG